MKVAALVRENGLYLKQNTVTPGLRGGPKAGDDGARRIAMHYKFSLEHAFERRPDVREEARASLLCCCFSWQGS